jgi:hypothetical protein
VKQKVALKDKKKPITQVNGKYNDISSADGNKLTEITVEPLFKNYKRQYIYLSVEDLRSSTCF